MFYFWPAEKSYRTCSCWVLGGDGDLAEVAFPISNFTWILGAFFGALVGLGRAMLPPHAVTSMGIWVRELHGREGAAVAGVTWTHQEEQSFGILLSWISCLLCELCFVCKSSSYKKAWKRNLILFQKTNTFTKSPLPNKPPDFSSPKNNSYPPGSSAQLRWGLGLGSGGPVALDRLRRGFGGSRAGGDHHALGDLCQRGAVAPEALTVALFGKWGR